MAYTAQSVREALEPHRTRLFSSYATGRPVGWNCDQRTKDLWCLGMWLGEEMSKLVESNKLDDLGRRVQLATFNRRSRSDHDLFELSAQLMNDTVDGNFDPHRKTHRRWG